MLRKTLVVVTVILITPLLVAMILALIVAVAVYQWARLRLDCIRSKQWTYLVCSPRHDWHEFLVHNVVPSLPAPVAAVWTASHGETKRVAPAGVLSAGATVAKPYLAHVRAFGIRVLSVHETLLPYKAHAKKATKVQTELRRIIAQSYERIVGRR